MIKLIGNKSGIYIDPRNCHAYIDVRGAENFNEVNFIGVNNVVIYREKSGKYYIAQAGGYTAQRGMFVDVYNNDMSD